MKLEIWQPTPEISKATQRLRLVQVEDEIQLQVVELDGHSKPQGILVTLRPGQPLYLWPGVNPDLGFPTDPNGCLKVVRND